jgi:hypothetical protein
VTTCVIDGVAWDVLGDFGAAPFVLDRDNLDDNPGSELTSSAGAATESIGHMLLSASWQWGAARSLGPLTEAAAGRAVLSLLDTLRTFDPINDDSAIAGYLKLDLPIVITADALPAFTGKLRAWSHDLGPAESTLELVDVIGEMGMTDAATPTLYAPGEIDYVGNLVGGVVYGVPAPGDGAATGPFAGRTTVLGTPGYTRAMPTVLPDSVLAQLALLRRSEHGTLVGERDGGVTFRQSAVPYAPASALVVNCGGVFLGDLSTLVDRGRVRNRVRIADHVPEVYEDAASISRNGVHEVASSVAELAFDEFNSAGKAGYIADPYGRWAAAILTALAEPAPTIALGVLRPATPTEVGKVARAESYDRWTVVHDHVVPPISRVVSVIGMRCRLTTTGLEADVVTEDVA